MDVAEHVLPDLLKPGLRIVFCGTAAGSVSAARGAYYAHPQNRFWSALHAFGLTPRKLRPEDYAELWQWGLGLTDIAKHVSGMDRELPRDALGRTACAALEAKIVAAEPEWLAFTSLNAGRRYLGRAAGFEKSGHFFFNAPVGRGYDDGFVTAIAILDMLDRNPGKSMADLYRELPKTWGSPTMSPHCADEVKYEVADRVVARLKAMQARAEPFAGQPIRDLVTVNGVRVTVEDGTWGLVRASSNKPELVVVVESPASEARMRAMFEAVDRILRENPEVGAYNQTI